MDELRFKDLKIGKYFFRAHGGYLIARLYQKKSDNTAICVAELCAIKTPYNAELNTTREFLPLTTIKAV